jgi:SAM-dependent methyltransferase
MKDLLRRIRKFYSDLIDYFIRLIQRKTYLPPRSLRAFVGPQINLLDYEATGKEFFGYFRELCDLRQTESILDVGCGCGQKTLPLLGYIKKDGHYWGTDLSKRAIIWCQRNITRKYPQFEFYHVDLFNSVYNPKGTYLAEKYRFPFKDQSFDFILLVSVFTHMLPNGVENYFKEIARLLKDEGRAFITFFLLNDEQQQLAEKKLNTIDFKFEHEIYRTTSEDFPESAIAYKENYVLGLISKNDVKLKIPIKYGNWSGRTDGLSYQDIVVVSRKI